MHLILPCKDQLVLFSHTLELSLRMQTSRGFIVEVAKPHCTSRADSPGIRLLNIHPLISNGSHCWNRNESKYAATRIDFGLSVTDPSTINRSQLATILSTIFASDVIWDLYLFWICGLLLVLFTFRRRSSTSKSTSTCGPFRAYARHVSQETMVNGCIWSSPLSLWHNVYMTSLYLLSSLLAMYEVFFFFKL